MQYKAHDYQEYAKQKIIEQKACGLFLEPGLGKTVITLSAIWELMFDYFDIRKVLVIAPLRVAENTWTEELEKWDHLTYLRISRVLGTEAQRLEALRTPADIYVINRENVLWLAELGEWDFDMLVIDELSSFKNASSKRFKALRRKRPGIERVVGLTGTPSTNGLMDLWPEIYLLDQGKRLGKTLSTYRADFFVPDRMNGWIVYSYRPRPRAEEWIYSRLADLGAETASGLTGAVIDANKVLISSSEDGGDPVAVGFRAKKSNGKYRYFWLYRVKFGIPATNLETKGDSITFSTPTIEGTILRRNKADTEGRHPWKAEVTEGAAGVSQETISSWYEAVYEPNYTPVVP